MACDVSPVAMFVDVETSLIVMSKAAGIASRDSATCIMMLLWKSQASMMMRLAGNCSDFQPPWNSETLANHMNS